MTVEGENIPGFTPKVEIGLKQAEKIGFTKDVFKGGKGAKYGYTESVGKVGVGKKTVLTKGKTVSSVSKPKTTLYVSKGKVKVAKVSEVESISRVVGKPVKGKVSYPTTVVEKGTIYDKSIKPTDLQEIFKPDTGLPVSSGGRGGVTKVKLEYWAGCKGCFNSKNCVKTTCFHTSCTHSCG